MHNGKLNKIRYDDTGKPMKQTSFTVKKKKKKSRGKLSRKAIYYSKEKF